MKRLLLLATVIGYSFAILAQIGPAHPERKLEPKKEIKVVKKTKKKAVKKKVKKRRRRNIKKANITVSLFLF